MMNTEAIKSFKALTSTIDTSSRDFIKSYGLSLFSIRRTYADGSILWLFNNPSYLEEYCQHNIPLPRPFYGALDHVSPCERGVYVWEEALPVLNISYAHERQKVFHGIALYKNTKDYCDVMGLCFGHEDINSPKSFYANILPELRYFKQKFFHDHAALLDTLYNQKIALKTTPLAVCPITELRRQCGENPVILQGRHDPITLCVEESLCFSLVQKGKTKYEMETILNISYTSLEIMLKGLSSKIDQPFYQINTPYVRHKLSVGRPSITHQLYANLS